MTCVCVCVSLASKSEESSERKLELAVAWNRVDLAESKIFTEERQWKVGIQHSSIDNKVTVPDVATEECLHK